MRYHTFLIKYGEIGIKGKNRYLFEDALVRQVRFALKGSLKSISPRQGFMWTVTGIMIMTIRWNI